MLGCLEWQIHFESGILDKANPMFSAFPVSDQQPNPVLPEHVQLLIKEGWVGECQPSGAGDAQDYVGRWLAGTTIAKMILSEVRFEIENLFVTLSSFSNYKLSRHSLDWPCRYNLSYFGPSGVRASARCKQRWQLF